MIPVISTWVIALLPATLLFNQGEHINAVGLVLAHLFVNMFVDASIYAELPGSHRRLSFVMVLTSLAAYFTALSVATGLYFFGSIEGVILGPLIFSTVPIALHFLTDVSTAAMEPSASSSEKAAAEE